MCRVATNPISLNWWNFITLSLFIISSPCLLIDTLYVNNTGDFLDKSYQGYTSIKKIIIPKNITTIGVNYLSNCTNLKTVKFLQNSELTSLGN